MKIILNGEEKHIKDNITVKELLVGLKLSYAVAVFINKRQLLQAEYEGWQINAFDKVRIFKPLSGG